MSSARSEARCILDLRPSVALLGTAAMLHLLAAAAIAACELPAGVAPAAGLAVMLSMGAVWRAYGRPGGRAFVRRVDWLADGRCALTLGDGRRLDATLAGAYLHPWLLIMSFETGSFRRRSVVIPRDASDREAIRRARVRLTVAWGEEGSGVS